MTRQDTEFGSAPRRAAAIAAVAFALAAVLVQWTTVARAQPAAGVYTYHNDTMRTGADTVETELAPWDINAQTFGKLFSVPIDGYAYAQPLYVSGVDIPGMGTRNVVYVATENDSVYAFDADNGAVLWKRSFIDPSAGITPVPSTDTFCTNLTPQIGITSTPVIDPATGTLYVVAETKENGAYFHRLHALDIATGAEKLGGPVTITASAPGTGSGSVGGIVTMVQLKALQRSALLLKDGVVYIAFASNCDTPPYDGWVLGYRASDLSPQYVFNDAPDGSEGGIWMSGDGPAASPDSGDIYVSTGNGTFDAEAGGPDYGDSVVRLSPGATALSPVDFFTPYNELILDQNDLDLGSGGVMLLPDQATGPPHLMVASGKEGTIYLINRDDMGGFNQSSNRIVQEMQSVVGGVFSTPSFWNDTMYVIGKSDVPKAFALSGGEFNPVPASQSPITFDYPGATTAISADGSSGGIVWAIDAASGGTVPVLYAFDASDLAFELYDAAQNSARDIGVGGYVKFTVPTIANGKVYVATTSELEAYTLFNAAPGGSVSVSGRGTANLNRHRWISGGAFEVTNTGTTNESITAIVVRFSNPTLFARAKLKGKAGRKRSHAVVKKVALTTTFVLKRPLIVPAGQAAAFTLKLKSVRGSSSSGPSQQQVYQVQGGADWFSGLPAGLGTIGASVRRARTMMAGRPPSP